MKHFYKMDRSRGIAGFTLIELMIVVAVVAIIASIAIPSYTDSVRKSRRRQAQADLTEVAQGMERYYTANGTYLGADLATLGGAQSPKTGKAYYTFAFAAVPTAKVFQINAAPVAATGQNKDKCGQLTLDQSGVKGVGASTVPDCW